MALRKKRAIKYWAASFWLSYGMRGEEVVGCRHGVKYANATENELILWFYGCDSLALDELWECRLRGWVTRFVASKVNNRADVDDVVNEITLKILETKRHPATRFNPQKGALRSWVAKIASNEIANYFRKQNQETCFSELVESSEDDEEETPDISETVLADKSDEEQKTIINDAVQRLGEPSRTIVKLLFWEEFTQKEISEELGIPLATVNRRLKHDLKCLKKLLKG